jgi:hypothetical protein
MMIDPADREDYDPHAELLTWEVLPMYFCGKCGVNARVSPGLGPNQKWACHVCLNVTTDLMQFERIAPVGPKIDIAAALAKLEEIVCTGGCDAGVVFMTDHGTTHREVVNGKSIQVYDHEYFSPLGDALIELYKILGGTVDVDQN